jgi:hypothetical protein
LATDASRELPSLAPGAVESTPSVLGRFKTRALSHAEVRQAYDDVAGEFAVLDEVLTRTKRAARD